MLKTLATKTQLFGALIAAVLLFGSGTSVAARDYPAALKRQPQAEQPPRISAGEAANIAQAATGAKVLAVSFRRGYYRVKLLRRNSVIITVKVDAKTGRMRR